MAIVERFGISHTADYRDVVEFTVAVPLSAADECIRAVSAATNARAGAVLA